MAFGHPQRQFMQLVKCGYISSDDRDWMTVQKIRSRAQLLIVGSTMDANLKVSISFEIFPTSEPSGYLSFNLLPHGDTTHNDLHDSQRLKVIMDPALIDVRLSLPTSPDRFDIIELSLSLPDILSIFRHDSPTINLSTINFLLDGNLHSWCEAAHLIGVGRGDEVMPHLHLKDGFNGVDVEGMTAESNRAFGVTWRGLVADNQKVVVCSLLNALEGEKIGQDLGAGASTYWVLAKSTDRISFSCDSNICRPLHYRLRLRSPRMHIDEDSAVLAESMRVLRSRSNGQIPISRLPDDILLMIFELFEEEKRLNGRDNRDHIHATYGIDNVPACLEVTHVCRHWRNVALGCPTLWTFINSPPPLWLDVMLQGSQKAPLVVTYKLPRWSRSPISLEDCFEKVLLHLPRIKHLKLRTYQEYAGPVMDLLSSRPASMLETFKFEVCGPLPMMSMSNTIFQAQAPLLRHLEVNCFDRRWLSCVFSGLRTLHVGGTSLPNLLLALRCMPALEQFMFQFELLSSDQPILPDKVPLARLKSIAIEASLATAVPLFAHLALPADVKIALHIPSIEGTPTFADLFSVMPEGSGPVLRSLRAIKFRPGPWSMAVQFSTSTAINSDYSWNPQDNNIRLSIEFVY
ncbi:hypothetical protein DFJ58DRAFT_909760 [Suillus subalutaceus]|uniref:uncharacterized protein n=1 Tax=Suillus subalutaceus TaxID=48586 RepID=UPI001B883DED|nr:uncharacterized protein DFJ58DRAFT_909760 [Suillus subalutaceus]KAG1876482.1 hypothetical protein DFJ58DRAFT_909760 [Suillus subalutaceus]